MKPASRTVWIGGLKDSVDLSVLAFKLLDERLDDNWVGLNMIASNARMVFRFEYVVTVVAAIAESPAEPLLSSATIKSAAG